MKAFTLYAVCLLAGLLTACNRNDSTHSEVKEKETEQTENTKTMETLSPKDLVTAGMNAFFTDYDAEGIKTHFAENYIQHNPGVPTGREPVLGFLEPLKKAGTTYKNHRIFQDGDFVVMHNTYNNAEAFGAKEMVSFDVFRVENGKIAEHWDALSPVVKETASGRSQVDGPTEITDTDKTAENKKFIKSFLSDVMFGENPEKITDYISGETYNQHNVAVKDGLDGLNEAIKYLQSENNMFIYKKIHRVLGEGNFVLSVCEGEWSGKNQAFYDLFRIENGKIVEHWDVIQEVPEKQAHENGMF